MLKILGTIVKGNYELEQFEKKNNDEFSTKIKF